MDFGGNSMCNHLRCFKEKMSGESKETELRLIMLTTSFNVLMQGAEIEVHREFLLNLASPRPQPTKVNEREIWIRIYAIAKSKVDSLKASNGEVWDIYQRLLEQWKKARNI